MRSIEFSSIVEANLTEVWQTWTTNQGVTSFFARNSDVELKIGGKYELYFDENQPLGMQGSEGMRVLSFIPERILSFEWNNPPSFPEIRDQRTWVVLEFVELDDDLCEVTLTHLGFGSGEQWDRSYEYFQNAWKTVLRRFEKSRRVGAIDWDCVS